MALLAIKGHATRGSEVIELLEMLGGKNFGGHNGTRNMLFFIHPEHNEILADWCQRETHYVAFTLEEFLEKFPYKVGDKVQHKGATSCGSVFVVEKLLWEDNQVKYIVNRLWYNNDKVKVASKELQPYKEETIEGVYYKGEINCYHQDFEDKVRIRLGGDFEIKVEDGKTYVVRKKKQYPKTLLECYKELDIAVRKMRDAIKEQFDKDLETCKELL